MTRGGTFLRPRGILARDTTVQLSLVQCSLCLVPMFCMRRSDFSRPALSSTHASPKQHEARRSMVTRTALKLIQPTGMLLPTR